MFVKVTWKFCVWLQATTVSEMPSPASSVSSVLLGNCSVSVHGGREGDKHHNYCISVEHHAKSIVLGYSSSFGPSLFWLVFVHSGLQFLTEAVCSDNPQQEQQERLTQPLNYHLYFNPIIMASCLNAKLESLTT